MEFFDCNCSFGKNMLPAFRYAADAEELIQEMDFCGIHRALVYHTNMRFGSPTVWNPRLVDAVVGQERLEGSWAILPPQTAELPQPEQFIEQMQANGIRAVRAFPQEHRYFLNKDTFGALFELFTRRRIPLFAKESLVRLNELL